MTKFAAYINSFDDGALFNIYSAFAKSCSGINTLYMKIRGYVAAYYVMADEWLQQMDQEGRQRFQPFCNTMKINYMKLAMQNLPQKVIFDNLAEWLHANTNQDETMHLEQ